MKIKKNHLETNAAGMTEFTGAVPAMPQNQDQLDNYKDVNNFTPRRNKGNPSYPKTK